MSEYDRLTTLLHRFQLSVVSDTPERANLMIYADAMGAAGSIVYSPGAPVEQANKSLMFSACVDWENGVNPLLQALPGSVTYDIAADADAQALVTLIRHESAGARCGAVSVLNRLCEVLIVRLLRDLMQRGKADTGLLAGLADARLSRAIVSMHDRPQKTWTVEDLAQVAGLSLSRFSELFSEIVGESPMAYLRHWRLILARQDLARGDRVASVARRYGYGSAEGFSRAYRRHYGNAPIQMRQGRAA